MLLGWTSRLEQYQRAIQRSRVSPFLFYVESDRVTGPLQQFQQTVYGEEQIRNQQEVFGLVSSINDALGHQRVPRERLKGEFHQWWGKLKHKPNEIWNNTEVESVAGFKWLFLPEDIIAIESRFKCEAIWVIASHPFLSADVREVMEKNIEGGCVYTFIFPDKDNETFISDIEKTFGSKVEPKPILRKVSSDEFRSIAAVDYILFNPDDHPDFPRQMFFKLPKDSSGIYWTAVEPRTADNFYDRFRRFARPNEENRPQNGIDKDKEGASVQH